MNTIALCMIVKNEEKVLERCLRSIASHVDEVIIVDTGSTDRTKEIAKVYTNKVFDFEWCNDFSAARNYSLNKATSTYCLILDADEVLHESSLVALKEFVASGQRVIGRVKRNDVFISNGEERTASSWISRIVPRGVFFEGTIHEQIQSALPRKNINILVEHDGYLHDNKVNRNLTLLLKELESKPDDAYVIYQIGKQYQLQNDQEQAAEYYIQAYNMIQEKDGFRNRLIIDLLYALKDLKAFDVALEVSELEKKNLEEEADFYFLLGLLYMEVCIEFPEQCMEYIGNIEKSYLQCIKIGDRSDKEGMEGTGSYLAHYNLGIYYELMGEKGKARECYRLSMEYGYRKAEERYHKET